MTKVNVRASATVPAATPAADGEFFIDARGRRIGLRTLSILEEMRLLRMLGGENPNFYAFCARLARVSSIDGTSVDLPQKAITFEHLAQRLGMEGVAALTVHLMTDGTDTEDTDPTVLKAEAQARDETERATVKN